MRLWRPYTKATFTKVSCHKGKSWWLKNWGGILISLSGLIRRVSHFINVVQPPGRYKIKVQLIKNKSATVCYEQTADRWYHQRWVTAQFELDLSQICNTQSISPSSQPDFFGKPLSLFWEWSSMTSPQTEVIMLLLWRLAKQLPFFRSASQKNSFTVKSWKTTHRSRERPLLTSSLLPPVLSPQFHTVLT